MKPDAVITDFAHAPDHEVIPLVQGFRAGLLFISVENKVELEIFKSRRAYWMILLLRNPFTELLSALHPRFRKNLFHSLVRLSSSPRREQFVAGMTLQFDSDLRLMDVGRSFAHGDTSKLALRQLTLVHLVRLGHLLGARRLVAETFAAYGNKLFSYGWQIDWKSRPIVVVLGCILNRVKPYSKTLK